MNSKYHNFFRPCHPWQGLGPRRGRTLPSFDNHDYICGLNMNWKFTEKKDELFPTNLVAGGTWTADQRITTGSRSSRQFGAPRVSPAFARTILLYRLKDNGFNGHWLKWMTLFFLMIARRSVSCGPPLSYSGSTKFDRPRNASVSKGARTSWTRGVRRKPAPLVPKNLLFFTKNLVFSRPLWSPKSAPPNTHVL